MAEPVKRGTSNSNARGSAASRRIRKRWLLDNHGDGVTVPCAFCAAPLTFDTVTVDRHPIPGCNGGTYRRNNIRAACGTCNSVYGGALRRSPEQEG